MMRAGDRSDMCKYAPERVRHAFEFDRRDE
jgi:hypothetical protein